MVGRARVGKRTKDLTKRLEPGDIAVIDHADLDRVAADGLIDAGVVAVVNAVAVDHRPLPERRPAAPRPGGRRCSSTTSARRSWTPSPTVRPMRLDGGARAGRRRGARRRATSSARTRSTRRMEEARAGIGHELQRFAENTLEYVQREAELVFAPIVLPKLQTSFAGRHALVVVRGHDYKQDLRVLRPYIREFRPVLIGVDGGADALLEVGLKPDIILGDFDSVSAAGDGGRAPSTCTTCTRTGATPGYEELQAFGKPYVEFVVEGTSEDAAMLLAYEARRQAHRRGRHPRHDGRVPRQGPARACRRRSSPGCASGRCSSTPRAWPGSTSRRCGAATSLLLVLAALLVMLVIALVSEPAAGDPRRRSG